MEDKHPIPEITVRSEEDLGNAIKRARNHLDLTQAGVGSLVRVKQATISSLENGNPGTTLRTLMLALSAMGLELVIRSRSQGTDDWSDLR